MAGKCCGCSCNGASSPFAVGEIVQTIYGSGIVRSITSQGMVEVELGSWCLANRSTVRCFMNAKGVFPASRNMFKLGQEVETIYGTGSVREVREDGIVHVDVHSWQLANGARPQCFMNAESLRARKADVPRWCVGERVETVYGLGAVKAWRPDGLVQVQLASWTLANGAKVQCFMAPETIRRAPAVGAPCGTPRRRIAQNIGQVVQTVYGEGEVKAIHSDSIVRVQLDSWVLANGARVQCFMNAKNLEELSPASTPTASLLVEAAPLQSPVKKFPVEKPVKSAHLLNLAGGGILRGAPAVVGV